MFQLPRIVAVTVAILAMNLVAAVHAFEPILMSAMKLRGLLEGPLPHGSRTLSATTYNAAIETALSFRRLETTQNAGYSSPSEVGGIVRKTVKKLRGGTTTFYNNLITAVQIKLCEQDDSNKIRFVAKTDALAYKYENGDCVYLKLTTLSNPEVVSAYSNGQCEVKPNCYWGEIEFASATERPLVYAGSDTMTVADADERFKEWAQGLLVFVMPGAMLGTISLLTMVFFLICRCCCNRCGGRAPREEGYTSKQKFLPIAFYLLFTAGVVAVSGAALMYRDTMLGSVDASFNATSETLLNGKMWTLSILAPLEDIRDKVVSSAGLIQEELDGTDFIEEGVSGLVTELETFGSYSADRTLPNGCVIDTSSGEENVDADGRACLPCAVCTTISKEVGTAADQIETNAGPGVAQLADVRKELNDKLVGISNDVRSAVNEQVLAAADYITLWDDLRTDVNDTNADFQNVRDLVGYGVMAFFVLALGVVASGLVGILFGLTRCRILANILHVVYIVGFLALFLTFIVSSLALTTGVIMGDVCEVLLVFSANWTVPLGELGGVVDACFQNQSLLDVFNLSSQLDFARGGIEFPDLEVTDMLDFSELDSFADVILATNESTFPFNETVLSDGIALLNKFATQSDGTCQLTDVYTVDNLLQPWLDNNAEQTGDETAVAYIEARYRPHNTKCSGATGGHLVFCSDGLFCEFSERMVELYGPLYDLASIKRDMGVFVGELHTNITGVTNYTASFKENTTALDVAINGIKVDLEGSLIQYVGDFEQAMYCTFIADGFFTIYEALCGDLMPALTMLALMLFFAGVFLIPVNICLIIAVKRLKARGNGHVMDSAMKFM